MSEQWHSKTLNTLTDIKARRKGTEGSLLRHDGVTRRNSSLSDASDEGEADVGPVVRRQSGLPAKRTSNA